MKIESPCTGVCVIDLVTKRCLGCERTRQEVARWLQMTPEERTAIINELPNRKGTQTA